MKRAWSSSLLIIIFLASIFSFQTNSVEAASVYVNVSPKTMSLTVGDVKSIKLSTNSKKAIKWKSSNSKIVSVSSSGKVTAKSVGKIKITAYIPNSKYSSSVSITVKKKVYSASGIFTKVNPSIVFIELYDKSDTLLGTGSGVIISKDGKIVTNAHVLFFHPSGSYVKVRLSNGQVYKTNKLVGYHFKEDLAVIQIKSAQNLKPATLGNSSTIKPGEKVYALGSPRGVQNTITEGIISNASVKVDGVTRIQTTTPIAPGSSGGALVNANGEVIGIVVSTLLEAQNQNHAIEILKVKNLKTNGNKTISEIGNELFPELAGTGTITEDSNADVNVLPYLDNTVNGTLVNNDELDIYEFVLRDSKNISFSGTMVDSEGRDNFVASLFDSNLNEYVIDKNTFTLDLKPGVYYIVVYAKEINGYSYNNDDYSLRVSFQ